MDPRMSSSSVYGEFPGPRRLMFEWQYAPFVGVSSDQILIVCLVQR